MLISNERRPVPRQLEELSLSAAGIKDDFYQSPLSWSSQNILAFPSPGHVAMWNASSHSSKYTPMSRSVSSLEFSNDGRKLAIGASDGQLRVWDVEKGKELRIFKESQVMLASLSWSKDTIASGGSDGSIRLHEMESGKVSQNGGLGTAHIGQVCGLQWRNNGDRNLIASGGNDNVLNIWDIGSTAKGPIRRTSHKGAVKVALNLITCQCSRN